MQYKLGNTIFTSKAEIGKHAANMLKCHHIGDVMKGEDDLFLRDLLNMHPSAKQKIGAGVSKIYINPDGWGYRCFNVRRIDNTTTDFSYRQCLAGKATPDLDMFIESCREAASDQISMIGQPGYHVHHEGKQFIEIVMQFIQDYQLNPSEITYLIGDNITRTRFTDSSIRSLFCEYHSNIAQLKLLTPEDHHKIANRRVR